VIAALIKWGFVLAVIAALVVGLSSKQVRTPVFAFVRKYAIQIILIVVIFTAILTYALTGT